MPNLDHEPIPTLFDVNDGEVQGVEAEGVEAEAVEAEAVEAGLPPLEIQVIRSKRRKKTAEARLRGQVLDIRIPAATSIADEKHFVDHFVSRFERSRRASLIDLEARANRLAAQYGLPSPTSIRWVSNQNQRWGSCTPTYGTIRLSNRMAGFPHWVIDYVIVHELAHLAEHGHGRAFWALVEPFPYVERARGYLIAKSEDGAGG